MGAYAHPDLVFQPLGKTMSRWHGLYSVIWNVTSKCNFSCEHCYIPTPSRGDLTLQEARGMIEQLAELGVKELYLSGGEPLIRKDLFTIIEHATDSGLEVGAITNGWYVTREKATLFRRGGIDHVSVSVDGKERTHNKFRNKQGSFKRCIHAIKMLKDAGVKVYLSPTISKLNLKELPELLSLTMELGVNFSTKVLVPIGHAKNLSEYYLNAEEQRQVYEYLFTRKAELGKKLDIITTCSPYPIFLTKGKSTTVDDGRIHGGCTGGVNLLNIGSDGTIFPCSRLQIPLGNVREDELIDVWYSSEVLAVLRNRNNLKGKCGRCSHKNWCGGCRAMALALRGDYLAEDPTCWLAA